MDLKITADLCPSADGSAVRTSLVQAALIGNESVPKNIINSTVSLFFLNAISILVISNRNSFRVLFD